MDTQNVTNFNQLLSCVSSVCKKKVENKVILVELKVEIPGYQGTLIATPYKCKVKENTKVVDIFFVSTEEFKQLFSFVEGGIKTFITNTKHKDNYLIWQFELPLE